MKGNYFCSDLQQAVLWMLLIPSLCLGTNVLPICQIDDDAAEAGFEGSIINPNIAREELLDCTLKLTGIPDRSWIGLYVETLTLPCESEYCSDKGWGRTCTTDESYIKIAGLKTKICQPTATSKLYYYKNNTGPVTVRLFSEYFTSEHSFNLTYRVASVIDIGEDTVYHQVDTAGQQSGYVVSHSTYGKENYGSPINSNLTLTNLSSNSIAFHFIDLDLMPINCEDKLIIYGLYTTTICANDTSEYVEKWKQFETINNKVTFQFVSDSHSNATESGFMFQYEALGPPIMEIMLGSSKTDNSTIGKSKSTQRKQIANKPFVKTAGISGTTPENPYLNLSDTAQAKAGAALRLSGTTPLPDGSKWYTFLGVGVGSGLLLAVVIAAVAAIAMKKRRNRKFNSRTHYQDEERTERGNGLEMTVIEVENADNDCPGEIVEDLEPSPRDEEEALLTVHNVHSDVDKQSVREEIEIASDTQDSIAGVSSNVPSSVEKSTDVDSAASTHLSKELADVPDVPTADVPAVPAVDEDNIHQLAGETGED